MLLEAAGGLGVMTDAQAMELIGVCWEILEAVQGAGDVKSVLGLIAVAQLVVIFGLGWLVGLRVVGR